MSERDPKRWLEADSEAGEGLRGLLQAGREEQPTPGRMASLAQRLLEQVQSGATLHATSEPAAVTGSSAPAAGAAGLPLSIPVSIVAGASAVLLAMGGLWMSTRPTDAPQPPKGVEHAPAQPAEPAQPAQPSAPAEPPSTAQPAQAQAPDADLGVKSAGPRAESIDVAPQLVPALPAKRHKSPARVEGGARKPSELSLIEAAHRELDRAPARALQAIQQHRRAFPAGQYVQERELLEIEALLKLGRTAQARRRAQSFLEAHPESTHRRKVHALLTKMEAAP